MTIILRFNQILLTFFKEFPFCEGGCLTSVVVFEIDEVPDDCFGDEEAFSAAADANAGVIVDVTVSGCSL